MTPCESCGRMTSNARFCGACTDEAEIHRLRAEVRDLKARLKACRDYVTHRYETQTQSGAHWSWMHDRATDLRRKNWRKP